MSTESSFCSHFCYRLRDRHRHSIFTPPWPGARRDVVHDRSQTTNYRTGVPTDGRYPKLTYDPLDGCRQDHGSRLWGDCRVWQAERAPQDRRWKAEITCRRERGQRRVVCDGKMKLRGCSLVNGLLRVLNAQGISKGQFQYHYLFHHPPVVYPCTCAYRLYQFIYK